MVAAVREVQVKHWLLFRHEALFLAERSDDVNSTSGGLNLLPSYWTATVGE